MAVRNLDVVLSFLDRKERHGAMNTDGSSLFSYGRAIGQWTGDEILMPRSTRFISTTTKKHRNLLRRLARERGIRIYELN